MVQVPDCAYAFPNEIVRQGCRWRRKGGQFGGSKGANGVVTLWTLAARSRAELDDSSRARARVVAIGQLGLPCGNRTASSYCNGSRHADRDHQVMISEIPVGVKENLLESRDYFFRNQFWLSSASHIYAVPALGSGSAALL